MGNQKRKELRKEFQEFFIISSLPIMRTGLFISIITFACFALFNALFYPGSPEQLYFNRLWIIFPIMAVTIMVTYIRSIQKWLNLVYILLNLLICLAIFFIGILHAHNPWFYSCKEVSAN